MTDNLETRQTPQAANNELIVYQLGEVKGLLTTMSVKFDQYKADTDKRLIELEKFQAAQAVQDAIIPKVDWQKILLAGIALISSVVAMAFGFYNHYL